MRVGYFTGPLYRVSVAVSSPRFEFPIRVYYEDTDAGGVVFYANYLKFFERARTEWLRACGVVQQNLTERTGLIFVVRHTAIDYLAPARLDDRLTVDSRVEKLGQVSIEFYQEVRRQDEPASRVPEIMPKQAPGGELLARGHIKVGCVERATFLPRKIPESIRKIFQRQDLP